MIIPGREWTYCLWNISKWNWKTFIQHYSWSFLFDFLRGYEDLKTKLSIINRLQSQAMNNAGCLNETETSCVVIIPFVTVGSSCSNGMLQHAVSSWHHRAAHKHSTYAAYDLLIRENTHSEAHKCSHYHQMLCTNMDMTNIYWLIQIKWSIISSPEQSAINEWIYW